MSGGGPLKRALPALFFFLTTSLLAQQAPVVLYRVTILTQDGTRLRGILDAVTDTQVYFTQTKRNQGEAELASVRLDEIRKVVLRSDRRRQGVVEGALLGGLGVGLLSYRSLQVSPPRSPVLFGINLTLATGLGAVSGAALARGVGSLIGGATLRPTQGPDALAVLRAQLSPFSYQYQANRGGVLLP